MVRAFQLAASCAVETFSHALIDDAREKIEVSALCYSRQEKAWSKKNHLDRVSYRMVYIFPEALAVGNMYRPTGVGLYMRARRAPPGRYLTTRTPPNAGA